MDLSRLLQLKARVRVWLLRLSIVPSFAMISEFSMFLMWRKI